MRQALDVGLYSSKPLAGLTPFQSQIMSYAKEPTAQVSARLVLLQVRNERQKYLLYDFFTIVRRQSEGRQIPEQRAAPLVKEICNFPV